MTSSSLRRKAFRALVGLSLVGAGLTATTSAHADPIDLQCTGTQVIHFKPGLQFAPRNTKVHVSANYSSCVSLDHPALIGTYAGSHKAKRSCLNPARSEKGVRVIKWSNGRASTFAFTRTVTNVGGSAVATSTGSITHGLFEGSTAVQQITNPAINILDCLNKPGVRQQSSIMSLTITSLL